MGTYRWWCLIREMEHSGWMVVLKSTCNESQQNGDINGHPRRQTDLEEAEEEEEDLFVELRKTVDQRHSVVRVVTVGYTLLTGGTGLRI